MAGPGAGLLPGAGGAGVAARPPAAVLHLPRAEAGHDPGQDEDLAAGQPPPLRLSHSLEAAGHIKVGHFVNTYYFYVIHMKGPNPHV